MKKLKITATLMVLLTSSLSFAATYNDPSVEVKETSPKYHPTKEFAYDESYHIAGVNMLNDRGIASERVPSSVDSPELSPKPWLYKEEINQEK